MFPKKVYHCPCASLLIKLCLVNGHYSFRDICKYVTQKLNGNNVYCCKCGDHLENVVFSCKKHMCLMNQFDYDHRCYICLRRYLRMAYNCCYEHTDFDLPTSIKKDKKTLQLIVGKL